MPRGRVVIRTATRRDAAGLALVYRHAFGPRTAREVRADLRPREFTRDLLVALIDGTVASTVDVQYRRLLVDGVPLWTGGIAGVATRWDYRGRGLATRLMKEAIRRIRARGVSNTSLFTGHNLPAIRIYERLGYRETSDWQTIYDIRKPVAWIAKRFEWRSRWLPQTPFGREILRTLRKRVLISTPEWKVTIHGDGRRFRVLGGTRGRPDVVMRGNARDVFRCFGDRFAFDRSVRRGTVRLSGDRESIRTWRRVLTLEWRE
jgi:ribosomal protein S18 acetylase RimI-like enzyme